MIPQRRSIEQLVEDQVKKWSFDHKETPQPSFALNVVTVSREAGSGGKLIAKGIAECIGFDLFHQEMIHEMAQSAHVSTQILESLDEKGLTMLEDWVAAAVHRRHLWPDEYLQHLLKVVSTIGRHGHAVMVGRGANFILPRDRIFRLRVVAPIDFRAQKVAEAYDMPIKDAHRRILKTESDRNAFIRKYFHADIADPIHYDLVVNTGTLTLDEAITSVCQILQNKQKMPAS